MLPCDVLEFVSIPWKGTMLLDHLLASGPLPWELSLLREGTVLLKPAQLAMVMPWSSLVHRDQLLPVLRTSTSVFHVTGLSVG